MSTETTPETTTAARPFAPGDCVTAGAKIPGGCDHWWEGTGAIESIAPAETHDGIAVPPIAYVRWDALVPAPCTHDRWNSSGNPQPIGGTNVTLTADCTAPAYPDSHRIALA